MTAKIKRIPIGPIGTQVMANVSGLRRARRMTLVELSDRLTRAGRPIPPLGLSRLEAGERRVDVDDLVALAQVFNVSPAELLAEVSVCRTCYGAPPAGFSCDTCGRAGESRG